MSEGVSTDELERMVANLEELTREDGRKHRLFGYEVVAGLLPYVREALANRKASAEPRFTLDEIEASLNRVLTKRGFAPSEPSP